MSYVERYDQDGGECGFYGTPARFVLASDFDALVQRCRELESERDVAMMGVGTMRTEIEALRKDAERYRTLRHSLSGEPGSTSTDMPCICAPMALGITYTPDGLDLAIDAAMRDSQ